LLHEGDYASLKARLRTFEARPVLAQPMGAAQHPLAGGTEEILRQFLDERDRIVVDGSRGGAASRRALANLTEL